VTNSKGRGKKLSWPSHVLSQHLPGGLSRTTKPQVRIASVAAEIRTKYLYSPKRYRYATPSVGGIDINEMVECQEVVVAYFKCLPSTACRNPIQQLHVLFKTVHCPGFDLVIPQQSDAAKL
jgi:hypothetical protein